jgi:sucrose-6-phosphate hydrolase SacC (GH32 family)
VIPFNQTNRPWRRGVAARFPALPALLALLALSAPARAGAATDIAAWPLDEQRGSRTLEAVSGRHDPVDYVFNHARFKPDSDPLWRPATACIKGGCLLFDGYSTDITAPGLTDAQLGAGWTISAWVAPHAFEWGDGGQYSAFLSQFDEAGNTGLAFGVYRFGTWGIKLGFGASVFDLRAGDRKLPKDAWSHVAASYDPRDRLVRLFLDGEQVAAGAGPAAGVFSLPTRALTIGRYSQPRTVAGVFQLNTFLGLMDEVRITAGAATSGDIVRRVRADLAAHGGRAPAPAPADVTISRSTFAGDRHRPQYHALPDSGWMNEPHAPFYQDGRYHLFFQKNPFGPFWHQIHWGHWASPDMVHWRELPIALAPEDDTLAPDGIWSGSATHASDGTPVLFFTAGNDKTPIHERTGLARPADADLVRWTKHPVPVTEQQPGSGHTGDFRDPFVFRDDAGDRWFQLVGSRIPGGSGTALVHESSDLIHWRYRGPLFTLDAKRFPGFDKTFELPVLLPIGKGRDGRPRHVFLTDVGAQAYYWIGVFDPAAARFVPDSAAPRVFDLGDHHFSGPSGFIDPKTGRTIVFSIAQGERTPRDDWASGWAHNAGLPITLAIGPDDDLRLAPIDELESLRQDLLLDLADVTPAAAAGRLSTIRGDLLEVELELELAPAPDSAARRGLVVRKTPDDAEHTDLVVDAARKRFEIDRTHTTLDADARSRGVQGGAVDLRGERLRLRVFVDRSMVEAYLNDRKSITSRMYPTRPDATGLGLIAAPGDRVVRLRVWRLGGLDAEAPAWHPSR